MFIVTLFLLYQHTVILKEGVWLHEVVITAFSYNTVCINKKAAVKNQKNFDIKTFFLSALEKMFIK